MDWMQAVTWPLLIVSFLVFWRILERGARIKLGWLPFALPAVLQFAWASQSGHPRWLIVYGCMNAVLTIGSVLLIRFLFKVAAAYKKK